MATDHAAKNTGGITADELAKKTRKAVTAAGTTDGIAILGAPAPAEVGKLDTATTELEKAIVDLPVQKKAYETAQNRVADAVVAVNGAFANYVKVADVKCGGSATSITTLDLDVAGKHTKTNAVTPHVTNLHFSVADIAGFSDLAWNSLLKLAAMYEIQTALAMTADPANAVWTNQPSVTKSSTTVGPFPSGTRIWARVRGNGPHGPGDWSDPATTTVS